MANTTPIYPGVPVVSWTTLTTANNTYTGVGTVGTVFTAHATNGSFVNTIILKALGSNAASVARIFINNGSDSTVAANNTLYREIPLLATTASTTVGLMEYSMPVSLPLPPGYKLTAVVSVTTSAGWNVTAVGGDY